MLKQQIARFIGIGIVNTLFGYSIYALLIFLGVGYIYAVFFSTVAGVLFNFKTIGRFVFQSNDNTLLLKFFGVYGIVYVVNIGLIKGFSLLDIDYYTAGFLALVPCAGISFVLNKLFVFRQKSPKGY